MYGLDENQREWYLMNLSNNISIYRYPILYFPWSLHFSLQPTMCSSIPFRSSNGVQTFALPPNLSAFCLVPYSDSNGKTHKHRHVKYTQSTRKKCKNSININVYMLITAKLYNTRNFFPLPVAKNFVERIFYSTRLLNG